MCSFDAIVDQVGVLLFMERVNCLQNRVHATTVVVVASGDAVGVPVHRMPRIDHRETPLDSRRAGQHELSPRMGRFDAFHELRMVGRKTWMHPAPHDRYTRLKRFSFTVDCEEIAGQVACGIPAPQHPQHLDHVRLRLTVHKPVALLQETVACQSESVRHRSEGPINRYCVPYE